MAILIVKIVESHDKDFKLTTDEETLIKEADGVRVEVKEVGNRAFITITGH